MTKAAEAPSSMSTYVFRRALEKGKPPTGPINKNSLRGPNGLFVITTQNGTRMIDPDPTMRSLFPDTPSLRKPPSPSVSTSDSSSRSSTPSPTWFTAGTSPKEESKE